MLTRRFAFTAVFVSVAVLFAPSAAASPVANTDQEYQGLGRVFPDPMAGCQNAGSSPCSPNAKGNVPAGQFIQFNEFIEALEYMNQKPEWARYMEVWPLDGKLRDGGGNGTSDVPGNNLGRTEFNPDPSYKSSGLPRSDRTRDSHDLIVVRVTDETVPDANKKRYTLSLSIHGIERAGVEGGTRAMEDLVTAFTAGNANNTVVPREVDPQAPTFADVLRTTVIYFTYPNPDGWQRGSVSDGGVFFQRYGGNGVDLNRDWPDIGFTFRPYSGLSEPETRAFAGFYDQVRGTTGDNFDAGDDLHGMPFADALSYTLLPHGKHDFDKDIRIRETAKTIHEASEKALSWSPIIQPNDAPRGGGADCVPGPLGDTCAKIYGQTWGTVYDTIDYTTTGTLGDWFDSSAGLNADGIDNEMAFSHLDKNIVFDPHTEQLHVDGNKALIYAHLSELAHSASGKFDPPGRKGYVANERLTRGASEAPVAPPNTKPHDPIDKSAPQDCSVPPTPDGCAFEFEISGPGVYNGGMRVDVTQANFQGIGSGSATLKVQCQGCDQHRDRHAAGEENEWITVAEDFNQAPGAPGYQQAGLTAAVNNPQAEKKDGSPVKWRALISAEAGLPTARVEFTSGRATTDGNTGGDAAPDQRAYDVSNTDFFRDLDGFVVDRREDFDTIDPRAVIAGRQSLDSFESIALADDPLPGYAGAYGGRSRPTGPPTKDVTYTGTATPPAGDTEGSPSSYHEQEFDIGPNDANATAVIRIEWISPTSDFDMEVFKVDGSQRVKVGESLSGIGTTNSEQVTLREPTAGKYVIRVKNYASPEPTFNGTVKFTAFPPVRDGTYSTAEKDAWARALREFVDAGGNLILTDGALRILPELTNGKVPDGAIERQTVYAAQTSFGVSDDQNTFRHRLSRNIDQQGARFGSGNRRQMFEPTPLGFAIQNLDGGDESHARQFQVDRPTWEKAGGEIAGTSIDAGSPASAVFDRVTLGQLKQGRGQIRIAGALLPQPTTEFDHPLGIEAYAMTYTGYIVMRNLFDTTARGLPGLPGSRDNPTPGDRQAANDAAGRNFIISRRAVKLRRRVARVRVSCRSPRGCKGILSLKLRKAVRVRRGVRRVRTLSLGKVRFSMGPRARNATLRVKLSRSMARAASTKRRERVTAVASVVFGDGTKGKPSRRFWLYRPSGGR